MHTKSLIQHQQVMEEVSGKKVMILLGKLHVKTATSSYYDIMIHILSEALG